MSMRLVLVLAGVAALGAAACSDSSSSLTSVINVNVDGDTAHGTGKTGLQISIVPHQTSCLVGQTMQFKVFVSSPSGGDKRYTVKSSDVSVATVDTTALATCLKTGAVTLTATGVADTTAKDQALLIVNPSAVVDSSIVLVSPDTVTIRVIGSTGTCANEIAPIQVRVSPAGLPVTYTAIDTTIALVSASGQVTGLKVGTTFVKAFISPGKFVVVVVNVITCVTPPPPPPDVSVSGLPPTLVLQVGNGCTSQPVSLAANLKFAPTNATLVWSTSNAAFAIVSQSGVVTPIAPGVSTITVTASANGKSASTSTAVTVSACNITPPPNVGVSGLPPTLSLLSGSGCTTAPFSLLPNLTVSPSNATLVWTSSNPTVVTVSQTGVVTVIAPGTSTITVTASANGQSKSANSAVTVSACNPIQGNQKPTLVVQPISDFFKLGANCSKTQTYQLTYYLIRVDGTTDPHPSVNFLSDTPGVISADATTGLLHVNAVGAATITGKLATDNTVQASVLGTVTNDQCGTGTPIQIGVSPPTGSSCNVGGMLSAVATVSNNAQGHWTTSNSNVGFVNPTGVYTGKFQCMSPGSVDVCFVVDASNQGCQTWTVNAVPQPKPYITITPNPATITLGGPAVQFTAVVKDSVTNQPVANQAGTWSSSRADVIAINTQSGLATAIFHGQAQICFQWNGNAAVSACVNGTVP